MNRCQVWPGRSAPYSGKPAELKIGSLYPLPTHTAVLTCGVKPTIHASLLFGEFGPTPSVPVFAADGRPAASASPDHAAIGSKVSVTSLATRGSIAWTGCLWWVYTTAPEDAVACCTR